MLKELLKHLLDCRSKDLKLVTDATVNHMTKKIAIILKNCIFNDTLRSQNECAELIAAFRLRVTIYLTFYFGNSQVRVKSSGF